MVGHYEQPVTCHNIEQRLACILWDCSLKLQLLSAVVRQVARVAWDTLEGFIIAVQAYHCLSEKHDVELPSDTRVLHACTAVLTPPSVHMSPARHPTDNRLDATTTSSIRMLMTRTLTTT